MTWLERAAADPSLRAFLDAHDAQAHVELQALRLEYRHALATIAKQDRTIADLEYELKQVQRRRA